jgi:DNA modification methylase
MDIQKIQVSKINPAVYNPRVDLKPGDAEYEKLKSSINTFGYVEPLVWNKRTGNLVGGHQRLKVLVAQGATEVEVSVVDLPLEKEKALNLALNRIQGAWDEQKLASLLQELMRDSEIDIKTTGFDLPEISEILDRAEDAKEDEFDFAEELGNIGTPITQKGELIRLGNHRLLCGDSSNPEDVAKLIGDAKVNLIFSDPPYNVDYYGGNRPVPEKSRPKASRNWERIYNDNLTQEEYEKWLKRIFVNVTPYIAEGAAIYIWNGSKQFGPMYLMLAELGYHVSSVLTWAKESFSIGYADYNFQTEFCLYGWKEGNGGHKWYGPTNESTLWQIKRDSTASYNHPTQKPVALAHRGIRNSSKRGDIVLDMFLGSGTTLIAADGLERACYGIEIDPGYCDTIVRRYIKAKGKDAVSEDLYRKYMDNQKEEEHGKQTG